MFLEHRNVAKRRLQPDTVRFQAVSDGGYDVER